MDFVIPRKMVDFAVLNRVCPQATWIWIMLLMTDTVSGGRYSDPSELPKLVAPLVITAAILLVMLGMVMYFYWKKGKLTCHCDCCIKFNSDHSKMENCSCDSNSPRESSQFTNLSSKDLLNTAGCGGTCRCEQLQKRLDAAAEESNIPDTSICVVCSKNETCSNCTKNEQPEHIIPEPLMPPPIRKPKQ